MSVKIERDTVRKTTEIAEHAGRELAHQRDLPLPGTSGKHPIAEKIGTAITGGKANAGTKGYLMVRRVAYPPTRLRDDTRRGRFHTGFAS